MKLVIITNEFAIVIEVTIFSCDAVKLRLNSLSVSGLEAKRTNSNSRNMSRLKTVAESEAKLFSSETRDHYQ